MALGSSPINVSGRTDLQTGLYYGAVNQTTGAKSGIDWVMLAVIGFVVLTAWKFAK